MKKHVLVTNKIWHDWLFDELIEDSSANWIRIKEKADFTEDNLRLINPDFVFIPHWSWIIPSNIYENFKCVVFHMTDLPFGRGGSPLQNLIVRGLKETKISAIKVSDGIDTGDVYLKEPLSLHGTAREIFERATIVIRRMIAEIIAEEMVPTAQIGEPEIFRRRKPEDSNIDGLKELDKVYDYIRMLDCEGYPPAYIDTTNFRINFSNARFSDDHTYVSANVRIYKK